MGRHEHNQSKQTAQNSNLQGQKDEEYGEEAEESYYEEDEEEEANEWDNYDAKTFFAEALGADQTKTKESNLQKKTKDYSEIYREQIKPVLVEFKESIVQRFKHLTAKKHVAIAPN